MKVFDLKKQNLESNPDPNMHNSDTNIDFGSMLRKCLFLDMYDIPCDNDDYAEFLKTLYAGSNQNQR